MDKMIYPKCSMIFRVITLIFRNIPKKHKLHYMGILLKLKLNDKQFPVTSKENIFKEAGESELKYIGAHSESKDYDVYRYRHAKGHICYCAKYQDEVMCYIWISFKVCGLFFGSEKEVELFKLKDSQAYSYDLYTYKKFRHKGNATKLQNFTNMSLQKKGINERLNIINPSFIGAMKMSLKTGSEPQRLVYIYGIKNYKKAFLGTTKPSNKLNEWKKTFETVYGLQQ